MGQIVTSDIYLVSALLTKGYEIKWPINSDDSRHFRFTLIGEGVEEMKQAWMNGTLEGNLTEFARCIKNVKLILHDKNESRSVLNAGV
jgi:hypothetical protein